MRAGDSLVTRVSVAALIVTTTRLLRMSVSGSARYSSAPVVAWVKICRMPHDELAQILARICRALWHHPTPHGYRPPSHRSTQAAHAETSSVRTGKLT